MLDFQFCMIPLGLSLMIYSGIVIQTSYDIRMGYKPYKAGFRAPTSLCCSPHNPHLALEHIITTSMGPAWRGRPRSRRGRIAQASFNFQHLLPQPLHQSSSSNGRG